MANDTQTVDFRERFKRAVLKIQKLNQELEVHRMARSEPVAVIGMSCRFPGGANDPEAYWEMLKSGRDGVIEVPADRWGPDESPTTFEPDETLRGTRWGGFLTTPIDRFDAGFFGISPREARSLDPQQRLLLEVAWEALERANIPPERLFGSRTGVFVGLSCQDYQQNVSSQERAELSAYDITGNMPSIAGGRLSYVLGLQGPNITLDTACSSSLVTVHLAVQSLRRRESDLALAGGVNLILCPTTMLLLARTGALSPDGRCKAFDASANGFVRGEGCGLVALKRLSDAQAEGDEILAVIRGTAVNQDGRSTGLTAPNVLSQKALLKAAVEDAEVDPSRITYVEAHGTGTSLGDPIEVEALKEVIGAPREGGGRCLLSSVKTNLGHLESAAGIAGLIKVILSLRHGEIPGQLHFKRLNPRISFDGTPFFVSSTHTPWPKGPAPRIAGVSGFGMSGTNAHVILAEAPEVAEVSAEAPLPSPTHHLAVLSARGEAALTAQAARLLGDGARLQDLGDVCHTLAVGRTHFDQRLAVVASDLSGLRAELDRFVQGVGSPGLIRGAVARGAGRPKIAFLFTGQGSQYAGMGAELYRTQAGFRRAFDAADAALKPHLGRSVREIVHPEPAAGALIDDTAFTQPALFALEYALATMWLGLGVKPDAVLGHSVGELAAAAIAGVMSLEDGARLIVERGRRMQALPQNGAMAALKCTPEEAEAAVAPWAAEVSIAAYNGPRSIVISGTTGGVKAISARLTEQGIKVTELVVSHAFHSPLMEPMLAGFEAVAASLTLSGPTLPLVSNLTGQLAGAEIATARYWHDHVRSPVRFAEGMKALEAIGCTIFIEMGPSPVLLGMGAACVDVKGPQWLPSLRKGRADWQILLRSVGALHVLGLGVSLRALNEGQRVKTCALPTYAFDRERHWVDRVRGRVAGGAALPHPLLGARDPGGELPSFTRIISADAPAYLADHVVMGQVVFPGAAYWEMARAAAEALFGPGAHAVSDVVLQEALTLPSGEARSLRLSTRGPLADEVPVEIASFDELGGAPVIHATATLRRAGGEAPVPLDLDAIGARCGALRPIDTLYEDFEAVGLSYGPAFQGVRGIRTGEGEALAEVSLPVGDGAGYGVHPALLDACLQTVATLVDGGGDAWLPFALGRFKVVAPVGAAVRVHARLSPASGSQDIVTASFTLTDDDGAVLAVVEGLRLKRIDREALRRGENRRAERWLHEIRWRELTAAGPAPTGGRWLILIDRGGIGASLVEILRGRGAEVLTVSTGASFSEVEPGFMTASPLSDTDLGEVIAAVKRGGPLTGIVHLWALDTRAGEGDDAVAPLRALCSGVVHLMGAVARGSGPRPPRMWWVTRGAQALAEDAPDVNQATLWGLGRVAALEHAENRLVLVDLDPGSAGAEGLAAELGADGLESQILLRGGARHGARLVPSRPGERRDRLTIPDAEGYQLVIPQRGSIGSLIIEPRARRALDAGLVEIEVYASGLNFRDVLNVLGMYPGDPGPLGGEAAGIVTAVGPGVTRVAVGDRVTAMGPASHSRYLVTDQRYVVALPSDLGFEEAATLPVVYLTAWYGLHTLAGLKAGERILIHAAAGGVGMAAVQLAQRVGAEVFATASPPKWDTLRAMGVQHIMNSRTLDFADEIDGITGGEGVDVVLNALTGAFITRSMGLLAAGGRFLEMGKAEIWTDEQVRACREGVSYRAYDLATVDGDEIAQMFTHLMAALAAKQILPIPHKTFALSEARSAFRFMAQARHIGKVVLANDEKIPAVSRASAPLVRADASYLVTGGMGALGLEVATWLADQGARHVALMGRRAPGDAARRTIEALQGRGVDVQISLADVADRAGLAAALSGLGGPPLAGVIHSAGIVDDGPLLQLGWDRFQRVMAPKVQGALNLHTLTREMDLDIFCLFSSAASVLGSPGQGNYAAANAYLDSLAQLRRSQGLPAVSIGWGAWAQGGMAQEVDARVRSQWESQGIAQIQVAQGLHLLGILLRGEQAHVGVLPIAWKKMAATLPLVPALLREVVPKVDDAAPTDASTTRRDALLARLQGSAPDERGEIVVELLKAQVAGVLGIADPKEIESARPLAELGMDSLMAVELRNLMSDLVGQPLPATLVFDYPTLAQISQHLLDTYLNVQEAPAEAPAPAVTRRHDPAEPIAVVGMACRFAGGVDSPAALWALLKDQRSGITEIPASRWDVDAYYDSDVWAPGKMYTRHGGFLEGVDQFEPGFFGIIRREAASMDPQQRILLEVSWEALENAAIPASSLMDSETGVFIGICTNDYGAQAMQDVDTFNAYSGTGNSASVAAGRISYLLGLQGPAISVDTACSSSLVGMHLAVQSLRSGESTLALAGGVSVILSPKGTLYFSKIQALAADGRTKAFDAAADGYVRAEGCGVVVLKRLSDAQRDGDRVLALIRGSAVNQDGRSNGMTAPNGPAQQRVVRRALAAAGVEPREVSYVEAHGTGTPLGDPIELQALGAVLKEGRPAGDKVAVGTVKTNIGHSEGAAGVAGVIKTILSLQAETIPANLNFNTPNPHVPWDSIPLEVVSAPRPWPRGERRRIAGISSFGLSGTNAHIVMEEAPLPPTLPPVERDTHLVLLSARKAPVIAQVARRLADQLEREPGLALGDVCATLATGRVHQKARIAFPVHTRAELVAGLRRIAGGGEAPGQRSSPASADQARGKVAWILGSQAPLTASEAAALYAQAPAFAGAVDALLSAVELGGGAGGLRDAVDGGGALGIFTLQWGLIALFRAWGLAADVALCSGVGLWAGVCRAGAMDPAEAAALIHRAAGAGAAITGEVSAALARKRGAAPTARLYDASSGGANLLAAPVDALAAALVASLAGAADLSRAAEALGAAIGGDVGHAIGASFAPEWAEALASCPVIAASPASERGASQWEALGLELATLYVDGRTIGWSAVEAPFNHRRVGLPTYPFQRNRYWIDAE